MSAIGFIIAKIGQTKGRLLWGLCKWEATMLWHPFDVATLVK